MRLDNKKGILICIFFILYITFVTAYAQGNVMSAGEICDKLNYEFFTDEVHFAVTNDLTLDQNTILDKLGISGATITWESSSPDVISTTGKVSRDKYRDKNVVLTATVSDGTNTETKEFEFTVLSLQAKLYMSENFGYDVTGGTSITKAAQNADSDGLTLYVNSPAGWSFSSVGDVNMKAVIDEESTSNRILNTYRQGTDAKAHYVRYVLENKCAGKVVWEADVKFDRHKPPQVYIIEIYGIVKNGEWAKERVKIVDFDIRLNQAANEVRVGTGYWNGETAVKPTYVNTSMLTDEWSRVKIVMDTESREWTLYINGEKFLDNIAFCEKNKTGCENAQCLYINDFQLGTFRLYEDQSSFYLDNLSVRRFTDQYSQNAAAYEIVDALTLDMITSQNPGSIQNELDLSLEPFREIIEENSMEVTWASSDEDVLCILGNRAIPVLGYTDRDVVLSVNINGAEKEFALSVSAEEKYRQLNAVYDALNFECFSDEPYNAVTKSFDLSIENLESICNLDGISVEFTSDNPDCVSTEGIVNRMNRDTAVTLTANISDDSIGYSRDKEIKVNVLSSDKNVHYSSNFRYPPLLGSSISEIDKWSNLYTTTDFVTTLENEENNFLLSSYRAVANASDTNFATLSLNKKCKTEFTVETRLKFLDYNSYEFGSSTAIYVFEVGSVYNISGKKFRSKIAEIRFGYDYGRMGFKILDGANINIEYLPELDRWFNLKLICNILSHDLDVYIDGVKINDEKIPFYSICQNGCDAASFDSIEYVRYNCYRGKKNLGIKLDDMSIISSNKLQYVCQLAENNAEISAPAIVKNIEDIDYFEGNTIDAVIKLANDTDNPETDELDVFLCVYDNGILTDIRRYNEPFTVKPGEYKELYFPDISWKPDFSNISVKCFVWKKNGLRPENTNTEIVADLVNEYSPTVIPEDGTNRRITYIDLFGTTVYKMYFSQQSWSQDCKKLYFQGKNYNIYEYNTDTQKIRFISKCNSYYGLVTVPSKNVLIYTDSENRIVEMNINTYQKRVISSVPSYATSPGNILTVTNDGKHLSLWWNEDNDNFEGATPGLHYVRFPVLDTETGEWLDDTNHYYGFSDVPPYNTFINPVYCNLLFYCHANSQNSDRLWVIDTDTDEKYNLYKQKPYTENLSGESVSHETWTYDGERMVMAISKIDMRQIGPNGVISINKDGKDRRVINDEYRYLHLGASPTSDRWIVGDTVYGGFYTDIVLVDCYTGKSYKLATVNQNSKDSVAHGHPAFTPDGKQVYFGMYNDDYSTAGIGIIDVSDIVENAPEHTEIPLSENCRTESADGFNYSLKKVTRSGKQAYETEAGKHINVNYLGEEAENASVTITIEYYAEDAQAEIEYYQWHKYTEQSPSKLEVKTKPINTLNGGWKTVTVTIDDINLEGYGQLGGDFSINVTSGKLSIGSVVVERSN